MKSLLQKIPATLRQAQAERNEEKPLNNSSFMLSSSKHDERPFSLLKNFRKLIVVTTLLTLQTNPVAAALLDEMLAKRKPEATIHLGTKEGAGLVKGEWRYSDTKIIETDFKAASAEGQPTGEPNKAYDFTPHAGGIDFDDSKWEVIDPTTLDRRRSAGKLAFNWYRIKITVPERFGNLDPAGATVVFATSVDDYA